MTWTSLFLYLAVGVGIVIVVIIGLIVIRSNKYIKAANKNSRNRAVEYIRKTSKHNKEERKTLKF